MRKSFVIAVGVVLLLALTALGAEEKKTSFYLGGGISQPSGTLNDVYKMGYHAVGGVGITVAPGLQFGPAFHFHTFSLDAGASGITGGKFTAIVITGEIRYAFPMTNSSLSPYLVGGLGMGTAKIAETENVPIWGSLPSVSETKMAFDVGAGMGFKAGAAMSIFIEARYQSILTEGESMSFLPITAGLRF